MDFVRQSIRTAMHSSRGSVAKVFGGREGHGRGSAAGGPRVDWGAMRVSHIAIAVGRAGHARARGLVWRKHLLDEEIRQGRLRGIRGGSTCSRCPARNGPCLTSHPVPVLLRNDGRLGTGVTSRFRDDHGLAGSRHLVHDRKAAGSEKGSRQRLHLTSLCDHVGRGSRPCDPARRCRRRHAARIGIPAPARCPASEN
jgi:hypothetical protein